MVNLDTKFEYWKKRLTDFGKHNRLINSPVSEQDGRISRAALAIREPDINTLWAQFSDDGKPLIFPLPIREDEGDDENTYTMLDVFADEKFYLYNVTANNRVTTGQSPQETQRTLRGLKQNTRTFIEEKGLNALHLAFGFLHWYDKSECGAELRSPLLLVPVQLSQADLFSPFILTRRDDEISNNPALSQKIFNDFGITLPKYNEDINFESYIAAVNETCASRRWNISFDVELSLYSFQKIDMYNDLEKNADTIKRHPIIRAIGGDSSQVITDYIGIEKYNHDAVEPQEVFCVADADSSQQDAIMLAKRGISFILHAPPGTGKSQTITNMIAELISDGKRALFVSMKTSALESVYKLLRKADLAPFCLALHSHNAKRREILGQLEISLKSAPLKATLPDDAFRNLSQLIEHRTLLNNYSNELHTVVEPLGKTIYSVIGKTAALEKYPDFEFNQQNAGGFAASDLEERLNQLEKLSLIIAESGYQKNNPWFGCNLTDITDRFREQFSIDTEKAIALADEGIAIFSEINELFGADAQWSFVEVQFVKDILTSAVSMPKVPLEWRGLDTACVRKCLAECEKNRFQRDVIMKGLSNLHERKDFLKQEYEEALELCDEYKKKCNSANEDWLTERDKISNSYDLAIFEIDAAAILARYRTGYRSIFGRLRKDYKVDRKAIFTCQKTLEKLSYAETLTLLEGLKAAQNAKIELEFQRELFLEADKILKDSEKTFVDVEEKIKEKEILLNEAKGNLENNRNWLSHTLCLTFDDSSDYIMIDKQLERVYILSEFAKSDELSKDYVRKVFASDNNVISKSEELLSRLTEWVDQSRSALTSFASLFELQQKIISKPLIELRDQLKNCVDNLIYLEYYIDYREIINNCAQLEIDGFIEQAEEKNLAAEFIVPAYEKCFYRAWLDAKLPNYGAVHSFHRPQQEDLIKNFQELDKSHLEISKAALVSKLISRLPVLDSFTPGHDELDLLKSELAKKRKFLSTRKLIASLPNLLNALKPCMMMSPLSVGTYLGGGRYEFDAVIFDEASQIRTEDAICALHRAKQAIIVGDSKQLPPADFSIASMSGQDCEYDEDGGINDAGVYESLLDEASLLPAHTLKWHYRSRDENLIAFSNAEIYRGDLVTFPSSIEKAEGTGVQYIHVPEGKYDRGGRKGNHAEAQKVAGLIFEHFAEHTTRSLGIITFGDVQRSAVIDALIQKRKEDPSFERFFSDDYGEPFFIKAIETVQGDVRDTIIISVGYAPDAAGKFISNFGSLSRAGGDRRLNVAVTRARHNVKLVGSIMPADIDIERTIGEGAKLLRKYIDFAINGAQAVQGEAAGDISAGFDSPFETVVYDYLTKRGYDVAAQIGCSGYRIDMAVRHPKYRGRFAIGIECDGAAYHSARTARDRDRLRRTILEDMGWTIYRVWSADWIKDPAGEGAKLTEVIEKAIADFKKRTPREAPNPTKLSDFPATKKLPEKRAELPRKKYVGDEGLLYQLTQKQPSYKLKDNKLLMSFNEFLALCQYGTPGRIKTAISENKKYVNKTRLVGKNKISPLVLAIVNDRNNDPEVFAEFFNYNADVGMKLENNLTILAYAIHFNKGAGVIAELIKAGADVNAKLKGKGGISVNLLVYAISNNSDASVIRELIKAGADVNFKNEKGITPLRYAKAKGNSEVISLLEENGARH